MRKIIFNFLFSFLLVSATEAGTDVDNTASCCGEGTICEASQEPIVCGDIFGLAKSSVGEENSESIAKILGKLETQSNSINSSVSGDSRYCKNCFNVNESDPQFIASDKALKEELRKIALQRLVDNFYLYKEEDNFSKYQNEVNQYLDIELTLEKSYDEKVKIISGEREEATLLMSEFRNKLVLQSTPEIMQQKIDEVRVDLKAELKCRHDRFEDVAKEAEIFCPNLVSQLSELNIDLSKANSDKVEAISSELSIDRPDADKYIELLLEAPQALEQACEGSQDKESIYRAIGQTFNPNLSLNFEGVQDADYIADTLLSNDLDEAQVIMKRLANLNQGFKRIFLEPKLICNYFNRSSGDFVPNEGDEISALKEDFNKFLISIESASVDLDVLKRVSSSVISGHRESCGDILKLKLVRLGCGSAESNELKLFELLKPSKADLLEAASQNELASHSSAYNICRYEEIRPDADRHEDTLSPIDHAASARERRFERSRRQSLAEGVPIRSIYQRENNERRESLDKKLTEARVENTNQPGRSIASVNNSSLNSPDVDNRAADSELNQKTINTNNSSTTPARNINQFLAPASNLNTQNRFNEITGSAGSAPTESSFTTQQQGPVGEVVTTDNLSTSKSLSAAQSDQEKKLQAEVDNLKEELNKKNTEATERVESETSAKSEINERSLSESERVNTSSIGKVNEVRSVNNAEIKNSLGAVNGQTGDFEFSDSSQVPVIFSNGIPGNLDELIQNETSSIGFFLKDNKLVITTGAKGTFYPADIQDIILDDSGAILSIVYNNKVILIDALNEQSKLALVSFVEAKRGKRLPASKNEDINFDLRREQLLREFRAAEEAK